MLENSYNNVSQEILINLELATLFYSITDRLRALTKQHLIVNGQPLIIEYAAIHDFIKDTSGGAPFVENQGGIISANVTFSTTRDGWEKVGNRIRNTTIYDGKPKIREVVDESGDHLVISPNSAGNMYDNAVLESGVKYVQINRRGEIGVRDLNNGKTRIPTSEELEELKDMASDIQTYVDKLVVRATS
ncbi:MAG: hypothetical protein JW922_03355 [Paludibacteraceae bacterium]|nr:hypothetical protein [Paludibacteraceae bacterium]